MADKSKERWYHSKTKRDALSIKIDSLKKVDTKHKREGYPKVKFSVSKNNSDKKDISPEVERVQDALFSSVFSPNRISSGYNNAIATQNEAREDKFYPYKLMANSLSSLTEIGSAGYTLMGGANKLGMINNPALRTLVSSDRGQTIGSTIGAMADSYQLYNESNPRSRLENSVELIGDAAGIIGGTNIFRNSNLFNRYGDTIDKALDFTGYSAAGYDALVKPMEWVIDKTFNTSDKNMSKKNGGIVKLSDKDEFAFRSWYDKLSRFKELNPNPDDENQYYDYRGFWKENPDIAERMLTGDKEAHFTDLYKLPGHPTFSNESKYGGKELGGKWVAGEDGKSYYEPSVFTRSYLDRTMNYLRGTGEGVLVDGEYVMPPKVPLRRNDGNDTYSVRKGDTLYKIAKDHDISLDELLSLNNISDANKIQIGQKINVPKREKPIVDEKSSQAVKSSGNQYTVKSGDNLYKIAKENGLSLNELIGLNQDIKDVNSISIGQKINLPEPRPEYEPSVRDYRENREEERKLNESGDNEAIIKSVRHDENYIIVDKKNKEIKVYNPDNELVYKTDNIDTGRSGDDYNTITYTDNGKLVNHAGNNSTPAGITMITGVSEYHGRPAFIRSRFNKNTGEWDDNLASSMHWERSRNGSNGCIRLLGDTSNEINKYVKSGSMVYTLPEKPGSRFVAKEGNLSFVADNPYGSNEGEHKNWDDYNVYIDKTYRPLDIDIDNSDIDPSSFQAILNPLSVYNDVRDWQRRRNAKAYASGIEEGKESIMKDFNMDSSTYNDIAEIALGIAGQESDYGTSPKYQAINMAPDKLVDFAKKIRRGKVSYKSRGITQMKIKGDKDDLKEKYKKYGINEESIYDPKNAGIATMLRLAYMYKNEVEGRKFEGAEGQIVPSMDALLYKWMGHNWKLTKKIADPENNSYIRSVRNFSNRFNMKTKFDDGGEVEEKQDHIYKRLTEEYDIEPMQAIAIVANLTHESGLVEDILGDSGASYGIQQWRDERRKGLEKYAKSKGHESPTLDDQVDYLMDEYSGGKAFQFSKQGRNLYKDKKVKDATFDYYQFSKSDFDNAASLHDAVIAWNQGVGRPNKEFAMNEERYRIAKEMASRYGTVSPEGENFYSDMGYMDPDNPPAEKQEETVDTDGLEDISNIEEKVDATPVNAAENYYEAFGKQIISGLFAEAKNNMPIGGGSESNTEVSEDMQRDKIAIERAIAEEKEKAKKQELLKVFLPNIQLAVKGVTQVGK